MADLSFVQRTDFLSGYLIRSWQKNDRASIVLRKSTGKPMNGGTPLSEPSFRPPYGRTTSTSRKLADRWTTALTKVRCAYHDAADGGEGDTGKSHYGSDGLMLMVMSAVVTAL